MPLSPIDVQQQTFKVALRGYAEDEVDEFLDEVVISLRDYEQRLRDAQERVAVLEEQLSANRETEDAMRRTFLVAQRTADAIVEEAKSESERILSDSRMEVARVEAQQTEEKAHLLAETALLRDRVHGLRASLAELASSSLRRLDALDVDGVADRISAIVDESVVDETPQEIPFEPVESSAGGRHADDRIDLDELVDREGAETDTTKLSFADETEVEPEYGFSADEDVDVVDEYVEADETGDDAGELEFEDDGDDDLDQADEEDVEVAKVPEWMTRDDSDSVESPPPHRRPWERDEG